MTFSEIAIGQWFVFSPGVWSFQRNCLKTTRNHYVYFDPFTGTEVTSTPGDLTAIVRCIPAQFREK